MLRFRTQLALALLIVAWMASSCAGARDRHAEAPREAGRGTGGPPVQRGQGGQGATAPAVTPGWAGAHETRTHAGSYLVRWRASLDPIVLGETFTVDAWVFDAERPEVLVTDVELDVDAGMPQHGHGMTALARVSRRADGGWRAEGLRFHMIGKWELDFDARRGARTERAQAWVELE